MSEQSSSRPIGASGAEAKRSRPWQLMLVLVAAVAVTGAVLWWANLTLPPTAPITSAAHVHPEVGEPGDPAAPARLVEVAMVEADGAMRFEPAAIEVARGDQVRFRITNRGMLDHEFILSTLTDNLQHQEEMKRFPNMTHSGPNSISLQPNASGEIVWRFTRTGSFDFSCLIPGHREPGMHDSVVVK